MQSQNERVLGLAVKLFLEARMKNEPADSRAVADDLVALAAISTGTNVADSLACLRKCAGAPSLKEMRDKLKASDRSA